MNSKMKYLSILLLLICFQLLSSCHKEESLDAQDSYVKTMLGDSDVVAVESLQLSDGNFLVVSSSKDLNYPGHLVKIDVAGNELWEKRVSPLTSTIYDVILLPGKGFAILGYQTDDQTSTTLKVGIYNNDGELTTTNNVLTGITNSAKAPFEMLQLSNGNFAFAGTDSWDGRGYLIITDNNFNLVSARSFSSPSAGLEGSLIRGICENQAGEIMITGSTNSIPPVGERVDSYTILLRTDLEGVKKSYNVFPDSGISETPNCLIKYKDGALGVSARFSSKYNINGTYVTYLNAGNGSQKISGRISLCTYDKDGLLAERKDIFDYPDNGQISSIKSTSDGGFILCGTVAQANSAVLVSSTKIYLLKIDANLNVQWSKIIGTTYPSYGVDAIQVSDGGYLVSGHQLSFKEQYDAVVIKTDENGNY
jgi:hypothetical protein